MKEGIIIRDLLEDTMKLLSKTYKSDVGLGTDGENISFHIYTLGILIKIPPDTIKQYQTPEDVVNFIQEKIG